MVYGGRRLEDKGRHDWNGILLSWEEAQAPVSRVSGVKHCRRETLYDARAMMFYYQYGPDAVGRDFDDMIGGLRGTSVPFAEEGVYYARPYTQEAAW